MDCNVILFVAFNIILNVGLSCGQKYGKTHGGQGAKPGTRPDAKVDNFYRHLLTPHKFEQDLFPFIIISCVPEPEFG